MSSENNATGKEPESAGRKKTFGEFVYTFRKPMFLGFVLLIIVALVVFFYKVESIQPNQAAAAEPKLNYIIKVVVPDQIIMVEIKPLDSFTGIHLPSILSEGIQAVSENYNIKQITPINRYGTVYSGSHGTVTAALMLTVEPKGGSS